MRPVIAVSLQGGDVSGHLSLDRNYVNMLVEAGATVICIPSLQERALVEQILGRADGLIIPGGHDINPALYGQQPNPANDSVVPSRDAQEPRLIDVCWDLGLPYLGICRGAQMANVVMGGNLNQDLQTEPINHRQAEPYNAPAHEVLVEPESLLARIVQKERITVNSLHHQAICELGQGLEVAGRAKDGTIEAVWAPQKAFFLCVQWHPELNFDAPHNQKIVAAFLDAARSWREEHPLQA